jgi:DNA ligase (NAD+)
MEASASEIEKIEGVGPTIAESVSRFFGDSANREEVKRLVSLGVRWTSPEPGTADSGGKFTGLSFVLTGTLSAPRSEFKQRIEAAGGNVLSSLSKKTDYLVAGESPGGKLQKARNLQVEVLDEEGLEALF